MSRRCRVLLVTARHSGLGLGPVLELVRTQNDGPKSLCYVSSNLWILLHTGQRCRWVGHDQAIDRHSALVFTVGSPQTDRRRRGRRAGFVAVDAVTGSDNVDVQPLQCNTATESNTRDNVVGRCPPSDDIRMRLQQQFLYNGHTTTRMASLVQTAFSRLKRSRL